MQGSFGGQGAVLSAASDEKRAPVFSAGVFIFENRELFHRTENRSKTQSGAVPLPTRDETLRLPNLANFGLRSDAGSPQLERQWDDLPHQAEAIKNDRGWRIKTLRTDSLLAKFGIREGDLVTIDSLQSYVQTEGDENLLPRSINILDRISM